jgi:hypothetical protein
VKYPRVARPHLSRPHLRSGWYPWGIHNGKLYVRGPADSESEARAKGLQMFPAGSDWSVEEFQTRDLSRAKRMVSDRLLSTGHSLTDATKPKFSKVAPLEQMRR